LEIPSDVLAALSGLVSEKDLQDANISFTADVVADQAALVSDINSKGGLKSAKVKSAGEAIDFKLSLITKDGKEHKLEKFAKPLKLKLKLSADANSKLAGIYYIADNKSVEFVGGKVVSGEVTANLTHFSTYAVLEYDKTFEDVSSNYWASGVIKNMSAKNIIAGVSDTDFAPNQDVTRAQFAAFWVRAWELKATGSTTFTDVAKDKWYATEVAAAAEAGIVSGRTDKIFAPEDVISREEMAIMIVRAHEYKTGKKVTASERSSFADSAKISVWAQSYVDAAYKLGYIQGRGDNKFAPNGKATLAESVQVVSLLVK
jgi:fructan beta-fructosidase